MEVKIIYTGPLFVKTWIYQLDDETVMVVDPGGLEDELVDCLKECNAKKLDIILTHGHFDHVGGVAGLLQLYPNSRVRIHKADAVYLGKTGEAQHLACFKPIHADRYIVDYLKKYEFPEPTDFLADGDVVNGFKVIHTPGHTPGSICLWNEAENILFAGDTLFYHSYGRTDLLGGDDVAMQNSLKKLSLLPPNTIVYPGHGSNTTIGAEYP